MLYLFISILAGAFIIIGRIINSNLAEKIGIFQGTFFNYIIGLLFSFIFLFLSNERLSITYTTMKSIPLWTYLGGLIGVLVIILSSYITPKMSSFYLTLIIFIGQLFTGIILDYFTINKLSIGNIIGGILVLIGLTYNLLIDKTKKSSV
ncbi:DMT family transporter [Clostridium sp. Marseille-Q2269]|uniref:DMT family transporter n=1 Tax=Clostridium sp. Marseille-Q2269 TaxID=2942205 RepID=UPI002072C36F|nr:DMT family transporter [Clostridium sp. Marseille-Q2269]